ncbi:MAG: hypothetical protein ACOYY2_04665 [Actinomycetota bacterium]
MRPARRPFAGAAAIALAAPALAGCAGSTPAAAPSCTVRAGEQGWALGPDQAANAATIANVGLRRGLPEQAAAIALATSLQESKLRNLPYGDRDSLGLFQQRPSQGWGSASQVMDPAYAAGRFYDALTKVPGWQQMSLTEAAQAVQRSAFGAAYAQGESQARALAAAFYGQAPAALGCRLGAPGPTEPPGPDGLTARAAAARTALAAHFPAASITGQGSTVQVQPVSGASGGWAVASWAVAWAQNLGVVRVSYDGRTWDRSAKSPDWRPDPAAGPGSVTVVLR